MTIKTISWFVGGYVQATPHDGADRFGAARSFIMDGDYFPRAVRMYLDTAPFDQAVILDLQDDGVSLFQVPQYPQVDKGIRFKDHDHFTSSGEVKIAKDSVLTLEIRQTSSEARNLTVELDLEEIE